MLTNNLSTTKTFLDKTLKGIRCVGLDNLKVLRVSGPRTKHEMWNETFWDFFIYQQTIVLAKHKKRSITYYMYSKLTFWT